MRLRRRNPRLASTRGATGISPVPPGGDARHSTNSAAKNLGDAHRVPLVVACCVCLVLLCFLLCFLFGCHGSILPFPFFMEFRNGVLLQLFECIESTQNEVKRKMIATGAGNDAPKSPARLRTRRKSLCDIRRHSRLFFERGVRRASVSRERFTAMPRAGECREASRHLSSRRLWSAIYNEKRSSSDEWLEGAQLWPVRMRL